jgi:hypothetical protein
VDECPKQDGQNQLWIDLGFNQLYYLDIYFLLVGKADLLEHYLD